MRANVREFCRLAAEHLSLRGPVYEFGSFQVDEQEAYADLRSLFAGETYVGYDARPGPGVDRVEDLEHLHLSDHCAAAVLCVDTLEHVFPVQRACDEIFRVLQPGGTLVVSVPFHFRIHAYPDDYWRLTPSCLRRLLSPYAVRAVAAQGAAKYPHAAMAVAVKHPVPTDFELRLQRFMGAYEESQQAARRSRPITEAWKRWGLSILRSKAERQRIRSWFDVRWSVEPAADGGQPSTVTAPHFRPLTQLASGGR